MRIGDEATCAHPCRGFAYLLLLVAIALIGLAASAAVSLGAAMARRDAERSLLAIGMEFEQALNSYAGLPSGTVAPRGARGPRLLDDLLKDPRAPGVRRHLRQLYADPLTGTNEWGIVRDDQGFIVGVYSLATGRPIQRGGFETASAQFEDADSYKGWIFGLRTTMNLPPPGGPQSQMLKLN